MRVRHWVLGAGLGASLVATAASAAQPERTGLAVGFGLGGGSVSWTWPNDDRRTEQSGAGNVRVAWAVKPDLLVGVEFWGWAKDYEIGSTPEDVPAKLTLWSTAVVATYFPGDVGFFLRGGLGIGGGRAEIDPPPSVSFPVSGKVNDNGFSLLAATGYEAGITSHMTVGGAFHIVYVGLDGAAFDTVLGYGLTAQLNWYW